MISKKTDFSKQFRYLQLEKTWGFETEMPIKNIGIQFIQGYGKKDPPGSDRDRGPRYE